MGETIEAGDKVTINYQGSLEDGTRDRIGQSCKGS